MAEVDFNNPMHRCRWCKYYDSGCCYRGKMYTTDIGDVYKVAEEGKLSEVIEETLNSNKPTEIIEQIDTKLLEWGVSEKRRKEIKKVFEDNLPEYFDFTLKPELDEAISKLYQTQLDVDELHDIIEILESDEMVCNFFE